MFETNNVGVTYCLLRHSISLFSEPGQCRLQI